MLLLKESSLCSWSSSWIRAYSLSKLLLLSVSSVMVSYIELNCSLALTSRVTDAFLSKHFWKDSFWVLLPSLVLDVNTLKSRLQIPMALSLELEEAMSLIYIYFDWYSPLLGSSDLFRHVMIVSFSLNWAILLVVSSFTFLLVFNWWVPLRICTKISTGDGTASSTLDI